MRTLLIPAALVFLSACQSDAPGSDAPAPTASTPTASTGHGPHLRIASWNLEHLAEKDASGCRPRAEADYAALKTYASKVDADVIAFQEVESIAAAQRVFDPAVYDVVMEARMGTPDSTPPCKDKPGLFLNRQAVGFAVRKGLNVERHPDFTALQTVTPTSALASTSR